MATATATRPRQLALPFDESALWSTAGLEQALAREAGRPLALTLTENRSVLLSFRRAQGRVELRLHRMFLHAPPSVVQALARGLKRTSRSADGEVRRFMNDNLHRVRKNRRGLPHLRELRSRARAHPHPSRAGPARGARLLPGERRLPRDAAPPPGRRPRPRGPHRLSLP